MHPAVRRLFPVATLVLGLPVPCQAPADVLRFYEPYGIAEIRLLDTQSQVVHRWPTQIWRNGGIDLAADGTLLRGMRIAPDNGVQRLAFDGTLLWEYQCPPGYFIHHDIEALPNGNVLLIATDVRTGQQAIAQGRNPAQVGESLVADTIFEVQQTGPRSGVIVWEWRVMDHLVQDFDPGKANFGVVADHPELLDINYPATLFHGTELNHVNGIDYDPVHDWIVVSAPVQHEVWIIDHSTTTAEAAGHTGGRWGKGGDLLYRWGNPAVYRAAPASGQQLTFQHDPRFVPPGYPGAGNVTMFSNNPPVGPSSVLEIVLPVDSSGNFILTPGSAYGPAAPVWSYSDPGLFSVIMSGAERLPNGNTLVCSGKQGWLFEVTPAGQVVWQHFQNVAPHSLFHAHHTRRSLWADRLSLRASSGGTVQFDLEAGSPRAGDVYVLLGSGSGTTPGFTVNSINVPLNVDGYLVGLLGSVGTGVFTSWVGVADATGGASANYTLPPLPFLAGLRLDHAVLTLDPSTGTMTWASNAVPLAFQ